MEVYNDTAKFIQEFDASKRDMTKYIIGTISRYDYPLTPSMKGEKAVSLYISQISQEDIQKERDEILNTKVEDLKKYAEMIDKVVSENLICVMGNKEVIKENSDLFDSTIDVFK